MQRRPHRHAKDEQRQRDGQRLGLEHAADDRPVDGDQCPVERVAGLGNDAPAHEDHHQRRHQRHRQDRRRRHRERLGERQRPEQAAFLRFQREDRQERHGDDEQREEQRRADLGGCLDEDLQSGLVGRRTLQVLVRVLDHDDGRVDHGADGDGDAAEAHDVGADAEHLHGDERHEDAHGEHQDGDQRAAHVQEEDDADQRDDHAFLKEGRLERGDGAVNELRAVVDRHHLGAFGQRRGNLLEALLDVVDDGERVGAGALQGDAARDLAFAVELGDAAPLVRADLDARDVLEQHRRAAVHLDDDLLEVARAFEIAAAAHHELVLGKLERAPADVHVAVADDVAHLLQRDAERAHAAGIDDDVVLLDEAADAGDLGDTLGLRQPEADLPVLQRAQVGEGLVLAEDRVLVDPADAAGVGPKVGVTPAGKRLAAALRYSRTRLRAQ